MGSKAPKTPFPAAVLLARPKPFDGTETINALRRIIAESSHGVYAERLIRFAEEWYSNFERKRA